MILGIKMTMCTFNNYSHLSLPGGEASLLEGFVGMGVY